MERLALRSPRGRGGARRRGEVDEGEADDGQWRRFLDGEGGFYYHNFALRYTSAEWPWSHAHARSDRPACVALYPRSVRAGAAQRVAVAAEEGQEDCAVLDLEDLEDGYDERDAATFRGYLWDALLQSGNGGDLDHAAPPARLLARPQAAQLGRDALRKLAELQVWLMEAQSERMLKRLAERERLREAVRERRATAEQLTKHVAIVGKLG